MEYLLDTANIEQIKKYSEILPISGVTTNPSIIKKEGKIDFFEQLKEIRNIIGLDKSLHVQVVAKDYDGIIKDAERIQKEVDDQVYIKVPVSEVGLKAIKALKARGFRITATAIYTEIQAYLAIEAGADYLAPYYNRMENLGVDAATVISHVASEIARSGASSKILGASYKNVNQVLNTIQNGAQSVTIGVDVLAQLLAHPSITKAVDDFATDWESIYGAGSTISSL